MSQIPKTQLAEMFSNIQAETPWDLEDNMLWGYFFTSSQSHELEKLSAELIRSGYHLVEIRRQETSFLKAPEWQLHVEQIETHSIDTLFDRNAQLAALADQYKNVIYDGMDVGPTEENK